jgi:hypothetical protein
VAVAQAPVVHQRLTTTWLLSPITTVVGAVILVTTETRAVVAVVALHPLSKLGPPTRF